MITNLKINDMENRKVLKFKTNINCGGCVAKVAPFLDQTGGIVSWEVATASPDRILTVHSSEVTEYEIVTKVNQAGFNAEPVN